MTRDIVLCIDDEPVVLEACRMAIITAGYTALTAGNAVTALRICEQHKDEIALAICDVVMPGMNGLELAESIRDISPQTKILLMSGYGENVLASQGELRLPFLKKPFIHSVLVEKIQTVLSGSLGAAQSS